MKHKLNNLFIISEALNGLTKLPVQTFISNDFDTAKLYFHDWLKDKKCKAKYQLYKIGEIDKDFKIRQTKIFITTGFEIENKPSYQRTLFEEKKMIEEAAREQKTKDILRKLFNGKEINVKG